MPRHDGPETFGPADNRVPCVTFCRRVVCLDRWRQSCSARRSLHDARPLHCSVTRFTPTPESFAGARHESGIQANLSATPSSAGAARPFPGGLQRVVHNPRRSPHFRAITPDYQPLVPGGYGTHEARKNPNTAIDSAAARQPHQICRDIMRKDKGLSGDLDRLPMLTWIMFLKFLDEMERVREEEAKLEGRRFRPAIERPYRWRDWAAQAEGIKGPELLAFINQDEATRPDGTKGPGLFAYLRGLQSSNGDRRDVIAKVFEGTVNRMVSGYLLRDVLNKVNEIHFTSRDEIHTLGLLYESMLKEMRDAAGDSGYTPRPLVKFIVTVVDPQLEETVLNPAAGTGGFLVESFEHLRAQAKKAEQFAHLQRGTLFGIQPKPLSLASAGGQGSEAETDCRYD
jgi:hypothetical protein